MLNRECINILISETGKIHLENFNNKSKITRKIIQVFNNKKEMPKLKNLSETINNSEIHNDNIQGRNNNLSQQNLTTQKNISMAMENSNCLKVSSKEIINNKSKEIDSNTQGKSIKQNKSNADEEDTNLYKKIIEELKNVNRDLTLKYVKKEEDLKIITEEKNILEQKLIQLQSQIDDQMKKIQSEYHGKMLENEEIIIDKNNEIKELTKKNEIMKNKILNLELKLNEITNLSMKDEKKKNSNDNEEEIIENLLEACPNLLEKDLNCFDIKNISQLFGKKLNDLKENFNKEIMCMQAKSEKRENDLYEYISKLKDTNVNLQLKVNPNEIQFQKRMQENLENIFSNIYRIIEVLEKNIALKLSENSQSIFNLINKQKTLISFVSNIKSKVKASTKRVNKFQNTAQNNLNFNKISEKKILTHNISEYRETASVGKRVKSNNLSLMNLENPISKYESVNYQKDTKNYEFPKRANEDNCRIPNPIYVKKENYPNLNSVNHISLTNYGGMQYHIEKKEYLYNEKSSMNNIKSEFFLTGQMPNKAYQLYLNKSNQSLNIPSSRINSITVVNRPMMASTSVIPTCHKLIYHQTNPGY